MDLILLFASYLMRKKKGYMPFLFFLSEILREIPHNRLGHLTHYDVVLSPTHITLYERF